jgi:hypothetical protein
MKMGGPFVIHGEQRKSRRFLIRLPVIVRWTNENLRGEAETKTQDVSSRGLRFDLPTGLKNGSVVEILMTLPHQVSQAGPVQVNCQGRVVRTNVKDSNQVEVAATIQRFEFIRDRENAP